MIKVAALLVVVLVIGSAVSYLAFARYSELSSENSNLRTQVRFLQSNITSIQSELITLEGKQRLSSPILLRTFGTALASYVERPDGLTYLRLTETGPISGAESALATSPFNATIAGNSIEWKAVANAVAANGDHTFWPMVLENSPGGTNAIEFEDSGGIQAVSVVSNGAIISSRVEWNATAVNTFKIVVVVPGQQVNFYINGQLVKALTTGIPKVDFLLAAGEVKGTGSPSEGVATLDIYGGLLVGS